MPQLPPVQVVTSRRRGQISLTEGVAMRSRGLELGHALGGASQARQHRRALRRGEAVGAGERTGGDVPQQSFAALAENRDQLQ